MIQSTALSPSKLECRDNDGSVLNAPTGLARHEKIAPKHLERVAVVYIRQSTPQQLTRHQESTAVQYNLKFRARQFGWAEDRIEIIDDDLGKSGASAEARSGFKRLVAEVTLGQVGMILGVEMSRLARSCKDWYQLLEVCALSETLIADMDGVYDPCQYNDRLLLGLKGTMSEAELHILKQRMLQGKLNKARRGELLFPLPIGYVRRANDQVGFDPDEQVQAVVRLVFEKFKELGTLNQTLRYLVKNKIQMGVRVRTGLRKGDLDWRRPNRMTLYNMLKNPFYAGAYVYGKRKVDGRRKIAGRPWTGRTVVKPEQCEVLIKDRFPAYLSWEEFERTQEQLKQNRSVFESMGAVRRGPALLSGLLICKKCGRRMDVYYDRTGRCHQYACRRMLSDYGQEPCQSLAGQCLDDFLAGQVLNALKPAALELSLEAAKSIEEERNRLDGLWKKRLERARYESERAQRQYQLVEPENRLVARQLEGEWEEKLNEQRKLESEYERFQSQRPRILTAEERDAIRQLAEDIPGLWHSTNTSVMERKEILRQVFERIVVEVVGTSEQVKVEIHWAGGRTSQVALIRPVAKLEQLSYYPELIERIKQLARKKMKAGQIADQLNQEGWRPPKRRQTFGRQGILDLMNRIGVVKKRKSLAPFVLLGPDEWELGGLARRLAMPPVTLYLWIRRGWVKARTTKGRTGRNQWVIWANAEELERLEQLRRQPAGYQTRRRWLERQRDNSDSNRN